MRFCTPDSPSPPPDLAQNIVYEMNQRKEIFQKLFLHYILNVAEKGIFPFVSKQESIINAGESFFQVCVMQHIFVL